MMSAKLATVALVKIKTFYDESCDVIISVSITPPKEFYHVTQIIF